MIPLGWTENRLYCSLGTTWKQEQFDPLQPGINPSQSPSWPTSRMGTNPLHFTTSPLCVQKPTPFAWWAYVLGNKLDFGYQLAFSPFIATKISNTYYQRRLNYTCNNGVGPWMVSFNACQMMRVQFNKCVQTNVAYPLEFRVYLCN